MFLNACPSYTLHRRMQTLLTSPLLCAVWPGLQGFFMKGFVVCFFFFILHWAWTLPLHLPTPLLFLSKGLSLQLTTREENWLPPSFLCQPFSPEEEGSSDDPVLCSAGGNLCFISCHPGLEGDGRKNPRLWRFGKDAEAHLCPPLCAERPVVLTMLTSTAITGTSSCDWVGRTQAGLRELPPFSLTSPLHPP